MLPVLDLYSDLTSGPVLITLTIAVITIVVTFVIARHYYEKAKMERLPYFALKTSNLIANLSSKITDFKTLYENKEIKNLTVAKIAIWNGGKETIRKEDVASPFVVRTISPTNILNASFVSEPLQVNQIKLDTHQAPNSVVFDFKFLEFRQGALFRVIFDGQSEKDLDIEGTVMGGKPLNRWIQGNIQSTMGFLVFIACFLSPILLLIALQNFFHYTGSFYDVGVAILLVLTIVAFLIAPRLSKGYESKYGNRSKLPKDLSKFLDSDW